MEYRLLYSITMSLILTKCSTHVAKNNSDFFISFAHSDIERPLKVTLRIEDTTNGDEIAITQENKKVVPNDKVVFEDVTDGVLFIPNDKPLFRNQDIYSGGGDVRDVVERRIVGDPVRDEKIHISETESPKSDILFVSGKNNENIAKPTVYAKKQEQDSTVIGKAKKTRIHKNKLNCANMNCNNTINSVCGARDENKKVKYRLFLNECFFRKVNCGFQNAMNRYDMVSIEYCKNIGAHHLARPFVFKPLPTQTEVVKLDARRSFSSRRSLNMGVDGIFCEHACPASCTEEYAPECAVTSTGQRRMFLNHCKLDFNSCLYKVVWHRRPMSECVGGRKADMTQNRGFIGWMQRVGILDGKGRLSLTQ